MAKKTAVAMAEPEEDQPELTWREVLALLKAVKSKLRANDELRFGIFIRRLEDDLRSDEIAEGFWQLIHAFLSEPRIATQFFKCLVAWNERRSKTRKKRR